MRTLRCQDSPTVSSLRIETGLLLRLYAHSTGIENMKRFASDDRSTLEDLLVLAASFDEGVFFLDAFEVHEFLHYLLGHAQTKLELNSELHFRGAGFEKEGAGIVTVRLQRSGLRLQSTSLISAGAA